MDKASQQQNSIIQRWVNLLTSRAAWPYWLLFGIAMSVRIGDQYFMSAYAPTYGQLWPDSHVYDRWAREIAQTFWLGWDRIPFQHGPLYPYFLGMLYLRFPPGIDTAAWGQRLLGVFTVLLIFWLAQRIFNKKTGWFAGLGAAFCPTFLMYESEILVETLVLFLNVATLCLFFVAAERKAGKWWAISGIGLGLCCLGRPNALIFLPALAIWIFLISKGSIKHRLMPAVLMTAMAVTVISPATLLNYFVGGEFCIVSATGPYNTYIGNAPDTQGIFASTPSTIAIREKEDKPDEEIDWRHYLIQALREDPLSLPRNLWKKTCLFWQSGEIPSGPNYYLQRSFSPFLRLPFRWALIAPLGLLGIFLAFKTKMPHKLDDPLLLLTGWLLLYAASIVLIFVMGRLRLPALAILFLFAGYALAYCLEKIMAVLKGNLPPRKLAPVLLIILLWPVLGFVLKTHDTKKLIGWNDYFNMGRSFETKEQWEEALEQYNKAFELAPGTPIIVQLRDEVAKRLEIPPHK
jgi:4-amino-4-deoxy-L-arabinose transferase-like glycosyltransferase